jgi:hypothetical protein
MALVFSRRSPPLSLTTATLRRHLSLPSISFPSLRRSLVVVSSPPFTSSSRRPSLPLWSASAPQRWLSQQPNPSSNNEVLKFFESSELTSERVDKYLSSNRKKLKDLSFVLEFVHQLCQRGFLFTQPQFSILSQTLSDLRDKLTFKHISRAPSPFYSSPHALPPHVPACQPHSWDGSKNSLS